MLSGETAIGEFPVAAVNMMQRIMIETETMLMNRASRTTRSNEQHWTISDAVIYGTAQIARRIDARLVFIATAGSQLPLVKSKQRDYVPTVCMTDNPRFHQRMSMYWSVIPVLVKQLNDENLIPYIRNWATENGGLASGGRYVTCLLYTSPSPRDATLSRMPSSA